METLIYVFVFLATFLAEFNIAAPSKFFAERAIVISSVYLNELKRWFGSRNSYAIFCNQVANGSTIDDD